MTSMRRTFAVASLSSLRPKQSALEGLLAAGLATNLIEEAVHLREEVNGILRSPSSPNGSGFDQSINQSISQRVRQSLTRFNRSMHPSIDRNGMELELIG